MRIFVALCAVVFLTASSSFAQDVPSADPANAADETPTAQSTTPTPAEPATPDPAAADPAQTSTPSPATDDDTKKPDVTGKVKELAEETKAKFGEIADDFDNSKTAKKAADGILGQLYVLAESLASPSFHWLAFALMATGVVSFAMQVVLGKLVVLFKGSINLREILSDIVGFIISAVGLVLTTQAAAENSTFTHSATSVLSSAAVGVVLGFTLYRWGQAQEVNAIAGQRSQKSPVAPAPRDPKTGK